MILHDSLGIAHELEQEMARVVETYQCEWQTTLNDPSRLALFRTEVNRQPVEENKRWQAVCAIDEILSRRGSAPGWGENRLRFSALVNLSMPSTTSRAGQHSKRAFTRYSRRCCRRAGGHLSDL